MGLAHVVNHTSVTAEAASDTVTQRQCVLGPAFNLIFPDSFRNSSSTIGIVRNDLVMKLTPHALRSGFKSVLFRGKGYFSLLLLMLWQIYIHI